MGSVDKLNIEDLISLHEILAVEREWQIVESILNVSIGWVAYILHLHLFVING